MRLADPKPGFCSVCHAASPDLRFVDCGIAYDGAPVLDRETGSIAILPWNGQLASHDDLNICEACVREMCELIGLKPQLHARQATENKHLALEVDHWRSYARRLEATLADRPEPAPRSRPQRRKVAA